MEDGARISSLFLNINYTPLNQCCQAMKRTDAQICANCKKKVIIQPAGREIYRPDEYFVPFVCNYTGRRKPARLNPSLRIASLVSSKAPECLRNRRGQLKNVPDAHFFKQCPLKFLLECRNFTVAMTFWSLRTCSARYSRDGFRRPGFLLFVIMLKMTLVFADG